MHYSIGQWEFRQEVLFFCWCEVAAHEGLLEGREDFFGEVLDYDGLTIKILGGLNRFLRRRGRIQTKI
jgi:hypothetical protein